MCIAFAFTMTDNCNLTSQLEEGNSDANSQSSKLLVLVSLTWIDYYVTDHMGLSLRKITVDS